MTDGRSSLLRHTPPTWAKVLLLPVTFVLMIVALLYMVVCEFAEGVWTRMVLMARREW